MCRRFNRFRKRRANLAKFIWRQGVEDVRRCLNWRIRVVGLFRNDVVSPFHRAERNLGFTKLIAVFLQSVSVTPLARSRRRMR